MMGVIDRMQWGEDGYQIATVNTHLYSPNGYDVEPECLAFIAIPNRYMHPSHRFTRVICNTLGQMTINHVVYPPSRIWELANHSMHIFELEEVVLMGRPPVIRNLVEEEAGFGWI
jgi:hypothetical protein